MCSSFRIQPNALDVLPTEEPFMQAKARTSRPTGKWG